MLLLSQWRRSQIKMLMIIDKLLVTKQSMGCTANLLNIFVTTVGEGEALEKLVTVCNTSNIYGLVIIAFLWD
jgi:hypothetical protein